MGRPSTLWILVENFGYGHERIRDNAGYFNTQEEAIEWAVETYGAAEGDGWVAVPLRPHQPAKVDLRPQYCQQAYDEGTRGDS